MCATISPVSEAVAGAVPKGTVIFCDANAGWTAYQARQFADATRAASTIPSSSPVRLLEENLSVRRMLDKPMVLDESVTSLERDARHPPAGHRRRTDAEDFTARRP